MKYLITILLVSVVPAAMAQLPIAEHSAAPSGPWTVASNAEVIDYGQDCYSLVLSEVSNLNESQYYRLRFPAGQEAVNARRMNYNSHLNQLVIEYFPSGPVPIIMVPVEGGTFLMGDEWGDGWEYERPVHEVTVSAFYMGKYEVTNDQMRELLQWAYEEGRLIVSSTSVKNAEGNQKELLDLDGSDCQVSWDGSEFSVDAGKEDYPCLEVSWYGSAAFCNYLSEMEGHTPCYDLSDWSCDWSVDGYRLPTEAEWEYAAKGGANGLKTKYAGSDDLDLVGRCWDNSINPENSLQEGKGSHPVGMKAANELGLYDMSGNVWEWCWDRYRSDYYNSSPSIDPRGPVSGNNSVARGGSWSSIAWRCRVAIRDYDFPADSSLYLGFRLARTVPDR